MLYIDFETRSEEDLRIVGAWKYSRHLSTEILCMAYAGESGSVELETDVEIIKNILTRAIFKNVLIEAHNAFFEFCLIKNVLGLDVEPDQFCCSMAKAAAHSLPRSLDGAAKALGLSHLKDTEGSRVMLQLAKPRKPSKTNPDKWWEKEKFPEKFGVLYAYCKQDVLVERELSQFLEDLNPLEQKVWLLDQKINQRGVYVDVDLVDSMLGFIEPCKEKGLQALRDITKGEVNTPEQVSALLRFIWKNYDVDVPNLQKETIESLLSDKSLPKDVRKLLEIRRTLSKSSLAKIPTLKSCLDTDNRIRGLLMYCGADTGRWSGRLVQPQNLPSASIDDRDTAIEVLKERDFELLNMLYSRPMEVMSSLLRSCFIASPGKELFAVDYASIEPRVLAWMVGDEDILDAYREGKDLYIEMAAEIFQKPVNEVTKEERFLGKQAVLGCGYQMGASTFMKTCNTWGVQIDKLLAEKAVAAYRRKFNKINSFWGDIENTAKRAVERGGPCRSCRTTWVVKGPFLQCILPSGRKISYLNPAIEPQQTSWGIKERALSSEKRNARRFSYGGLLTENVIQAIARDFLAEAMLRVEEKGYDVLFTVHDELIAERNIGEGSLKEFESLMAEVPEWAEGCPIAVDGWKGQYYKK